MSTPRKVVIIGGGFAGLACAQELANDSRFEVTLLDRSNHHLFQPLLYQVATASLAAPDIARSLRGILTRAKNITVLLDEITGIDPDAKVVRSKDHTYPYDDLVLAMGAVNSYFGNDHWAEHSIGLKTLAEAQEIRARVLNSLETAERSENEEECKRLMTIAIVGGGPTGVELAGAFSDLVRLALKSDFRRIDPKQLRIILIQSGDRILRPFDPEHSDYAHTRLEELGVEIRLGARVDEIEHERLHLTTGEWIEAATIIWAAGVQANPLTSSLDSPRDRAGRLEVSPDLSLPKYPHIFAAGDLALVNDAKGNPVPGLAPAAAQMGKHIAKLLKEDLRLSTTRYAERREEFRPSFKYRDKGIMAIIGKNCAVAQAGDTKMKGLIAWMAWLLIHLLFLVGFRNKLSVLLQWAWAYVVDKPGARVISQEGQKEP